MTRKPQIEAPPIIVEPERADGTVDTQTELRSVHKGQAMIDILSQGGSEPKHIFEKDTRGMFSSKFKDQMKTD